MIPRPGASDLPEPPERTSPSVRGSEPPPLLLATLEELEELKKTVKALGDEVKEIEGRVRNLESEKI